MRRIICLVLSAVLLLGLAAGCGKEPAAADTATQETTGSSTSVQPASGEKAKLTVWVQKTFAPEADEMLAQRYVDFGKANNAEVTIEMINSADTVQKANAELASGQVPDLQFMRPFSLIPFVDKNMFMDVSDLVAQIETENGPFLENAKEYVTFDGKMVGVPMTFDVPALIYRKDLLAKAGYNEPPDTWEKLREIAKAVTDPSKGIYGLGEPLAPIEDTVNNERCLLWSYGGREVSEDGKTVTINSPETLQAIKLLVDMFKVDKSIPPAAVSWDGAGNNTSYLTGQSAMVFNMPTILGSLETSSVPNLKENTGIAIMPSGPAGRVMYGGFLFNCISSSTKYPDLVKKMAKYVYDDKWYGSWLSKTAPVYIPTLKNIAETEEWQTGINKVTAESMKYINFPGFPGPLTAEYSQYDGTRMWGSMLQKILVNNQTPEEALKEMENEMNKIYKK